MQIKPGYIEKDVNNNTLLTDYNILSVATAKYSSVFMQGNADWYRGFNASGINSRSGEIASWEVNGTMPTNIVGILTSKELTLVAAEGKNIRVWLKFSRPEPLSSELSVVEPVVVGAYTYTSTYIPGKVGWLSIASEGDKIFIGEGSIWVLQYNNVTLLDFTSDKAFIFTMSGCVESDLTLFESTLEFPIPFTGVLDSNNSIGEACRTFAQIVKEGEQVVTVALGGKGHITVLEKDFSTSEASYRVVKVFNLKIEEPTTFTATSTTVMGITFTSNSSKVTVCNMLWSSGVLMFVGFSENQYLVVGTIVEDELNFKEYTEIYANDPSIIKHGKAVFISANQIIYEVTEVGALLKGIVKVASLTGVDVWGPTLNYDSIIDIASDSGLLCVLVKRIANQEGSHSLLALNRDLNAVVWKRTYYENAREIVVSPHSAFRSKPILAGSSKNPFLGFGVD